ncbi:hypothetical protein [Pseudarthrobacter sp. MDT3-1]
MDLIALGALVVSGLAFGQSWITAYQTGKRSAVTRALEILTSEQIAEARTVIGQAARKSSISAGEKEKFVASAFRVMWALQSTDFAIYSIRKTALAPQEAVWLYRHLENITRDLHDAIRAHGTEASWEPTLTNTNAVLVALPEKVKNQWGKEIARKNVTLLPQPALGSGSNNPQLPGPTSSPNNP